ncbi:MAG TPA: radical SAM protein [Thermoanaerobaculia bacterium]|jgi:anaerobic magnesium-protoporphyrin IX monomethyl ester cyclase
MIDVLLAHSFFLRNDPKQVEKMRPYAPLGTLYAAAHLRSLGCSVALFDAMLAEGIDEYVELLDRHRPKVVALYEDQFNFLNKMCLSHARQAACRMSALARERGARVVAAGAEITDHPEIYFPHGVEYALLGEADHTLAELVPALLRRSGAAQLTATASPITAIAGLAWPDPDAPGGVARSAARPPERQPDVFPFPAWDLLDVERYRAAWRRAHGTFSLNMVTTRGCPFHCNWCAKPIWGQRYAMRSAASVADEMALLKRTLKPDHLWFADDIFGLQPRWVAELAAAVEERDAAIPFMIQSRVDLMTKRAVEGLARAGCAEVWLGVESGSQKILDAMDKGTRAEQIPVARERLRSAGIRACYFLQLGYPGETFEDILTTARLVRDTLPDDIGVSVSYPLPGTKFHAMVNSHLGEKDRWDDSSDLAMMFQGTYQTPFYRELHRLLHRELDLRREAAGNGSPAHAAGLAEALGAVAARWSELEAAEAGHRSLHPTAIEKDYGTPAAPDLSRTWN